MIRNYKRKQSNPRRRVRSRRRAGRRSEGPQHVTVHGRDEVILTAAEEFRRLKGDPTGQALITAMQASPLGDIDIEPARMPLPVRGTVF